MFAAFRIEFATGVYCNIYLASTVYVRIMWNAKYILDTKICPIQAYTSVCLFSEGETEICLSDVYDRHRHLFTTSTDFCLTQQFVWNKHLSENGICLSDAWNDYRHLFSVVNWPQNITSANNHTSC